MSDLINPACLNKTTTPFIKADGTYLPCCYASTNPDFVDYLKPELYSELNLNLHSVEEIANSTATKMLTEKMLSDSPFNICKRHCSKEKQRGTIWTIGKVIMKDGLNTSTVI